MIELKKNIDTVAGLYTYLGSSVVKATDLINLFTMLLLCVAT